MFTALIVDDELFVRKGLIKMIDWERSGYVVSGEADNGEDALAMIREHKPDLVVTDIRMPVIDGIGLIRAAVLEKLDTEFIIVSGYNEFEYARQAVRYGAFDYVLKPIDQEDFEKTLGKLKERLEEKERHKARTQVGLDQSWIEALIRGEENVLSDAAWKAPWEGEAVQTFTYALLEWNDILPWNGYILPAKDMLRKGIREAVHAASGTVFEPVLYEHHQTYGLVVPDLYARSFGGDTGAFLAELAGRIGTAFSCPFRIYAGPGVPSLKDIKHSYLGAKEVQQHKYLIPAQSVIAYEDISGRVLNYRHLEDELYRKLIDAVEENDEKMLVEQINHLFHFMQEKSFSPEAMKAAVTQCVLGILKSIQTLEGDEKELAYLEAAVGWYDRNITLGEITRIFTLFAREAAGLLGQLSQNQCKGGIQKIKCYVDEHYHESITLKEIAARFYMNSAYLGQLFKKTYGSYFNEYLQQLRITEAKRLLRQSDMRIYEIAQKVGFSNADYFVTQFEKLEQMTPTEYRNRIISR
ncbi:response regulator transcription factor [Paenibacillus sp. DMB5]|uniref:response regulator transcription factor n=1 Tax=Paenibacillus sp. DMB5 TaxID=1780103 RepID=UPI00076C5BFA|nr:response regulator transcription factor [Paenibacillus sp. DMB5]KUP23560.1 hypothetical protein AWJ19_08760 [Paenibacillus sp. DMB5]KUP25044.1 hypothetical protein AWJ19_05005 [Paenibacillus sp. DMB5]